MAAPFIEMRYPTVAAPTTSWVPTFQPSFPSNEPSTRLQLRGQTGGGTKYYQDKGIVNQNFNLQFDKVTKADRDLYQAFFDATVGAINTFEYLDRYGTNHTCRLVSGRDVLQEVSHERFSGLVVLEKES